MVTGHLTIDPTDPVFISYRQSDGSDLTAELAWLLRAAGVPVWRDKDDLPPGDTNERLGQAIANGLSGGVLVITPEVVKSDVVREVEAPKLVKLHESEPEFTLGIVNSVERAPGKTDYTAPDTLLKLPDGTLSGTDQQPSSRDGLRALVRGLQGQRVAHQREAVADAGGVFTLSVQTRNLPQVYDRTGSQLDIRVRPSAHERLPDPDGLRDLTATIGLLPDAVTRGGARRVHITGGAHLSVAFALGAALPSSRVGAVDILDQREEVWSSGQEAVVADPPRLRVVSSAQGSVPADRRPVVALHVDLLPSLSPAAFERFLDENGPDLAAWTYLAPAGTGLLDPSDAPGIAGELAARIRELSTENQNAEVHLLLRTPFPVAVLVGRLTNTVRTVLYEWDDSDPDTGDDFRPRYVPTVRVRASAASGVITDVLI